MDAEPHCPVGLFLPVCMAAVISAFLRCFCLLLLFDVSCYCDALLEMDILASTKCLMPSSMFIIVQ